MSEMLSYEPTLTSMTGGTGLVPHGVLPLRRGALAPRAEDRRRAEGGEGSESLASSQQLGGRAGKASENRLAPDHDDFVIVRDLRSGADDVLSDRLASSDFLQRLADPNRRAVLVALGALLGVLGSLAAGRFLEAFLFDVSSFDPLTLVLGRGASSARRPSPPRSSRPGARPQSTPWRRSEPSNCSAVGRCSEEVGRRHPKRNFCSACRK